MVLFCVKVTSLLFVFVAPVVVVSWNEKFKKLTSGDEKGNIIVWILVKCWLFVNVLLIELNISNKTIYPKPLGVRKW